MDVRQCPAELGYTALVLSIMANMKKEGISPDLLTYNTALEPFAHHGMSDEALSLFDDMKALDIPPDTQTFNLLLKALRFEDVHSSWQMVNMMKEFGVEPNAATYEVLVRRYKLSDNFEMGLKLLFEMEQLEIAPSLRTVQDVIALAIRKGHARLALELAENYEASSIRRLDDVTWIKCLTAATGTLYAEGVLRLWEKVVHSLKVIPDEGVCMEALHTAGRHGLPELAMDVLTTLRKMEVPLKEYHFAPIVEAFCQKGSLKEAFAILCTIREHGIIPNAETSHPIFLYIRKNEDALDEAWSALEALHEEGRQLDITAINVIVQASVSQGDLQRAIGTYQLCSELGLSPNVDTFNFLLSGAIGAQHRELGDRIVSDMKQANVCADGQTYERLVILCLTGETYEDAFFFLEEMKANQFVPPLSIYEAIIRRCVVDRDSRYKVAVEELQEQGYSVSRELQAFIDSGGVPPKGNGSGGQNKTAKAAHDAVV
ncbi:hypothetical protein OF83DRAFT_1146592 [Amylostereum chailletii]|nr:hypothetical protein OF83DRAFT_1146592 [Amylostereum chailletii]